RAQTVLGALRASLEEQLGKAKSSDVALTPSQILSLKRHPKLFQVLKNVMNQKINGLVRFY
ncbi:MAG: hypothetical protein KAU91_02570, partial [Candidatus Aminicenantes bacterium]|nr:hypothetical protein [Candidatus Aminicenantes bacterium]